jgi:hypothetical protein
MRRWVSNKIHTIVQKIKAWNWGAIRIFSLRSLLTVFVLFFIGVLLLAIAPSFSGYYVRGFKAFGGLPEPDQNQTTIVFVFYAPTTETQSSYDMSIVQRRVFAIFAPEKYPYLVDRFCFDDIKETRKIIPSSFLSESNLYSSRSHRSSSTNSNYDPDIHNSGGFLYDECMSADSPPGKSIQYAFFQNDLETYGVSKFYFPYDDRAYESVIWVDGNVAGKDEEPVINSIAPQIAGGVFAPNWDVSISLAQSESGENFGTTLRVEYKRPLINRILTPLLLFMIFGIIVSLPFIKDTSTFVEMLIGTIFGLCGLHDVLIPAEVTWSTVIDSVILFLYSLLGFFVLLRVAVIPAWKKLGN